MNYTTVILVVALEPVAVVQKRVPGNEKIDVQNMEDTFSASLMELNCIIASNAREREFVIMGFKNVTVENVLPRPTPSYVDIVWSGDSA